MVILLNCGDGDFGVFKVFSPELKIFNSDVKKLYYRIKVSFFALFV